MRGWSYVLAESRDSDWLIIVEVETARVRGVGSGVETAKGLFCLLMGRGSFTWKWDGASKKSILCATKDRPDRQYTAMGRRRSEEARKCE